MYWERSRFRCRSSNAITWSSKSRRQLPTQRSAIPFCQELRIGSDSFPMIAQKGQPALGGLKVLGRSFHPAGNGSFRHVEAEHQEFAMDARRTPTGIVSDHLKDQFTDLLGDPAATAHWIRHFAEHGPVQFESGSMPARNGVRQDDKECLFPVSPEPASYDPEEFVDGSQSWPRLLAFKDGELLAKGEVFEHQTAARPKPAKHGSEPEPKQVQHGNQVIADRLCRPPCEVVDFTAGQDCDEGQIKVAPVEHLVGVDPMLLRYLEHEHIANAFSEVHARTAAQQKS